MVSGTLVLTDTIDKAFDSIFSSSYEQTDAVVSGKKLVEWSQTGKAQISPDVLAKVRALPEVEAAAGTILDLSGDANQAKILDRKGKAIQGNNPTFGLGVDPADERFNPFKLVAGDWASGPRRGRRSTSSTADEQNFNVGDTVKVAGEGPVRGYELTGIVRFGDVNSLGGATIALFDVDTARSVLGKTGLRRGRRGGEGRRRRGEAAGRDRGHDPGLGRGQDRRRAGQGGRRGRRRVRHLHPLLPARVRRDRALRRGVRHLQHALDHGRAADEGARDPAHARRLAAPGAPLRDARGTRCSASSPRRSGSVSASCSRRD